jgi:hypothetical protein
MHGTLNPAYFSAITRETVSQGPGRIHVPYSMVFINLNKYFQTVLTQFVFGWAFLGKMKII